MKNFSTDFPVLSQYTYINTAFSGLLSEGLMEWRQEHDVDFLIGGSLFRESGQKFLEGVRKTVADFFNAEIENTMLVPNFSFGFNALIGSFEQKQRVLLLENDYPSVNWPVQARDHDVYFVKVDEHLEESISKAIIDLKPTVFAFSIVQYISGIKIDLEFIKNLKLQHPELLIVADATQYCGTEVFDFSASGIDVLGSSGYKWLLAGYGNGFLLFKEGVADKLYTHSFKYEPQKELFLKDKNHLMNHFEPGHLDTLNFGSLQYSIQYLQKIGMDTIQSHINELSAYAKDKFLELGLLEDAVVKRKVHSNIFNIKCDQKANDALKSRHVVTSVRGNGTRLSFHFYNTKKEIDKIAAILVNVKK